MPLPGSDKYRVIPVPKPMTWEQKIIERARKEIPIEDVLSRYYKIYVPYDAVSWKTYCPWAFEHEDNGRDKQFRVYSDSNNGYCFAMHGRVDNLRLYQELYPGPTLEVAKNLLEDYDIDYRKHSYQEEFKRIRESSSIYHVDEEDIVAAMKWYLNTLPFYESHQYDEKVIQIVQKFLNDAHDFCEQATKFEEVNQWYQEQKIYLHKSLSLGIY